MKTMRELETENRSLRARVMELEVKSGKNELDEPHAEELSSQTGAEEDLGFSGAVQASGQHAKRAIKSKAKKHLRDNPHLLYALSPERELISRVPNLDSRSARDVVREVGKRR